MQMCVNIISLFQMVQTLPTIKDL